MTRVNFEATLPPGLTVDEMVPDVVKLLQDRGCRFVTASITVSCIPPTSAGKAKDTRLENRLAGVESETQAMREDVDWLKSIAGVEDDRSTQATSPAPRKKKS